MRLCHFNYPFLDMYNLEEIGIIGEWFVLDGHVGQIVIPTELLPRLSHRPNYSDVVDCARVEAKVLRVGHLLNGIMEHKPLEFIWADAQSSRVSDVVSHPIGKGLIKAMRKEWHTWKKIQSRYVLYNLSYQLIADDRLRIDLFPNHLVVSFWFNKFNNSNPCPHHRIIAWNEFYGAREALRRVEYIRKTSLTVLKTGGSLPTKMLFLSDLYSESNIMFMIHKKVISKDSSFLHPQFGKWGRFTTNDDLTIWADNSESFIRKIRV